MKPTGFVLLFLLVVIVVLVAKLLSGVNLGG